MTIDFNKPLEAVHEDGTITPITDIRDGGSQDYQTLQLREYPVYFMADGLAHGTPWTIRNAVKEAPQAIPAPIAERMRGLIADIAERRCVASEAAQISARAIMAELEPATDDEAIAKQMCAEDGWLENGAAKALVAKALARGRELEREGR